MVSEDDDYDNNDDEWNLVKLNRSRPLLLDKVLGRVMMFDKNWF